MTYEQALEWVLENWDMYDYEDYEEWRNDIFLHFRYGEGLEDSATFNSNYLEKAWLKEFGSLDAGPDIEEEIIEEYEIPESRIIEVRLPRNEVLPRTRVNLETVTPQQYKSERYKPSLERQVLQAKELHIHYSTAKEQKQSVTFFDRFKRRILTVFRRGKK